MCVNNLSNVALDSAADGIEPAISSRKSNALTTTPQSHFSQKRLEVNPGSFRGRTVGNADCHCWKDDGTHRNGVPLLERIMDGIVNHSPAKMH